MQVVPGPMLFQGRLHCGEFAATFGSCVIVYVRHRHRGRWTVQFLSGQNAKVDPRPI
jgi:hypothetical protein